MHIPPSVRYRASRILHIFVLFLGFSGSVCADTPLGWINSGTTSAYTTTQGDFEIAASIHAVNSTIDFLDIREDLFASNRRLVGKSGDLSGHRIEAHYGITDFLSVFARYQEHELTVDLGEISAIEVLQIDKSLDTTRKELGLKWMLYEADLLNPNEQRTALSLQVSGFQNETENFDVLTDQLNLGNVTVFFRDPTTFSVSELEDDGWTARLLYTRAFGNLGVGTVWGGYGRSSATSGTTTNAANQTINNLFTQRFELEETYFYLGASINARITPRIPISISYEYIDINDTSFSRQPAQASTQLPSFLSSSGPSNESGNHTLSARVSYWLTPQINMSVTGNLYSNQFLGRLPHYNNPLSESFASVPYGFIGAELGYRF